MRQRLVDTVYRRERARVCESLQYILTGKQTDTHNFVAVLAIVTWVVLTVWMMFIIYSYMTETCRNCKCVVDGCGTLISTSSGDVFCTAQNTYLRPTLSVFSPKTYTETVDLCDKECSLRLSNTVKINYTNIHTGHQLINQVLNYAESRCIQLKVLTRNPNCNNVCKS